MSPEPKRQYIRPGDVPPQEAEKVLSFLNAARTAEELAETLEIPGTRDVGIKIAESILDRREVLGGFKDLTQVDKVPQIGPVRFGQIVSVVRRESMPKGSITFEVQARFEGVAEKEQPPETLAYAFDATGRLLASAPVKEGRASLSLPAETSGQTVRFFLGPRSEEKVPPTISRLLRMGAYERRLRIDPGNLKAEIALVDPVWRCWLLCRCVVRGRVVKRLPLPDGTVRELPICHSRVTICEVDAIPRIIWRLPDDLVVRLRDDLIDLLRRPFPIPPEPIPEPFPEPWPVPPGPFPPGPGPGPMMESAPMAERVRFVAEQPRMAAMSREVGTAPASRAEIGLSPQAGEQPKEMALFSAQVQDRIRVAVSAATVADLRRRLVDIADLIRPNICFWPWFEIFVRYTVDCFRTVGVDENGRFETVIFYPCFGDRPDLYFRVEQLHGAVWETIYAPPVRCNTYWDYACGTEVTIVVTDPSAIPCAPADPVDPPPGILTWVMPYAVGGTKIWGTPPGGAAAPAGWVKSDGFTAYGSFVNAPFGSRLGFRHSYSNNIPDGIKYYRWSYRKVGTLSWLRMSETVTRTYVKQSPGVLPTFPAYILGPKTVGANSNLFEFKPPAPPSPDAGDPAGTITYWPTDDAFADIYTGFLTTPSLPPDVAGAAGQYQVKLEVFDGAGTQVVPGPGTFRFIVPTGVAADGLTILAREAEVVELNAGGFVFNLQIDNNHCSAGISAPNIGGVAVADVCGFLRYNPAVADPVTIAFQGRHPNDHATFTFRIFRGAVFLAAASAVWQEVGAAAAGPYAGDGDGNFTADLARAALLGACIEAAFAETLYVYAKATTGWGTRISDYDASAVRAFALAPP